MVEQGNPKVKNQITQMVTQRGQPVDQVVQPVIVSINISEKKYKKLFEFLPKNLIF